MLNVALVVLALVGSPPTIELPSPTAVQRGTTAEVRIEGKRLGTTTRALFSPAEAISAEIASKAPGMVVLRITTSPATPLGPCELRLATPDGVSNAVTLHVVIDPVIHAKNPDQSGAAPHRIAIPSVISGVITRGGETDRLRFAARAKQPLVFEIHAVRGGSMLEPAVTVEDARGRTVAWEDNRPDGDALVRLDPPVDGDYDLVIRDLRYRGGKGFHYRIVARGGSPPNPTQLAADELAESEPNNDTEHATEVEIPCRIRGAIERHGDTDVFRFQVDSKQTLVLDVSARSFGSPLDALLLLHNAKGNRIVANDDNGGPDARIRRKLAPGTYTATVKDVTGASSRDHRYLLEIGPPSVPAPAFSVRFLSDTPRVGRGSHRKLWCQATRTGGFKDDVELTITGLPDGVSASPVTLGPGNGWTSVFTLDASAEAALDSSPITIEATGKIGDKLVTVHCVPEAGGKERQQAYVTVLDHPPLTVQPLGPLSPEQRRRYAEQLVQLRTELGESAPADAEAMVAWKTELRTETPNWIVLTPETMTASTGSKLQALEDGSVLATGDKIQTDTYTLVATTGIQKIGTLRLQLMPDEALPRNGPGRNPASGNFVLSELRITAAPASDPEHAVPVRLVNPQARFSQQNYAVAAAVDGNPGTGWAVHPQEGQAHWAVFDLETPIGHEGGTRITVTMDQQHGSEHLLGRFRLSAASTRLPGDRRAIPEELFQLSVREKRSDQEEHVLETYFRTSVSERLATVRERIGRLEAGFGSGLDIEALERELETQTPELTAAQRKWEAEHAKTLTRWIHTPCTVLTSVQGVRFEKQADDVVKVRAAVGVTDTYTIELATDVSPITGIRIDALADKTLPAGGPGLGVNGNFVLSKIALSGWPKSDPAAVEDLPLHGPQATFEQRGWPVRNTLDGNPRTGWAIAGNIGKDSAATWQLKQPLAKSGGTVLRLVLEHQSVHVRHVLGKFRVSVTSGANPGLGNRSLPRDVARILAVPEAERSDADANLLAAHYRSIAPELDPIRHRITSLRAQQVPFPPRVARGKKTRLAVRVNRREGFDGPIKVSLEGFSSGRDGKGNPKAIATSVKVDPVTAKVGQDIVVLDLAPGAKSELGTRSVVIRAEAKVGNRAIVEYSAPIPLEVIQ